MTVSLAAEVHSTIRDSPNHGLPPLADSPPPVRAAVAGCGFILQPAAVALPDRDLDESAGLGPRDKKKLDRFSTLSLAAAKRALRHAHPLDGSLKNEDLRDCGIFVGNTTAGWTFTEPQLRELHRPQARIDSISPYLATAWFPAAPQGLISIQLGLHGFSKTIAGDRCAGSQAIGLAFDQIQLGRCEMALAGGVDAPLTPFVEAGCRNHRERERLAEGAAFLVLQASGTARVGITGHRLLTRLWPGREREPLWRWMRELPLVCGGRGEPLLVVSPDEQIAMDVVREVLEIEPELPLRTSGDALAASAAAGVIRAVFQLEKSAAPRSALALCVGHRYVHALMLRAF